MNVTAIVTSAISITVTWNEVDFMDQNGVITMYEVMYIPQDIFGGQIEANATNISASEFSAVLQTLQEYVNYSIRVRAYTNEGPGPYSDPIKRLTLQDCK